jgi:hypothetical protein
LLCQPGFARAEISDAALARMEHQIQAMQAELARLKASAAAEKRVVAAVAVRAAQLQAKTDHAGMASAAAVPAGYALVANPADPAAAASLVRVVAPRKLPQGAFALGDITVTLGGFLDLAGIYRSRNQVADSASSFNTGIPLANSPNFHLPESRLSAHMTRFSMLAEGRPDDTSTLSAYAELDLQGAAPTSTSTESNSYVPRLRLAFASYSNSGDDFYVLAGQNWSLLSTNKAGMGFMPSNVAVPPGIEAAYSVGFSWARQPQIRVVKGFDHDVFSLGLSLENPQGLYAVGPNGLPSTANGMVVYPTGTVTYATAGGTGYASSNLYSADIAPDLIVKAAYDPSFGHFEAYGIGRLFQDRDSVAGAGSNHVVAGGGGGAGAIVHAIPQILDLQASTLAGVGLGRYSSTGLPDATIGANGMPKPLPDLQALLGLIYHPIGSVDLYAYGGYDAVGQRYFTVGSGHAAVPYGYGNPLYPQTGCGVELETSSSSCVANTSNVAQLRTGLSWRVLHGSDGTVAVGAEYEYLRRKIFGGAGTEPKTDDNIVMMDLRYFPFQ